MWFSTPRDATRLPREMFDVDPGERTPKAGVRRGYGPPTRQVREDWDLVEIAADDSDAAESVSESSGSEDAEQLAKGEDGSGQADGEELQSGSSERDTSEDDTQDHGEAVEEVARNSNDVEQHTMQSTKDAGTVSETATGGSAAHGGMAHALYVSVAKNHREYQNAFALSLFTMVCSLFGAARATG